MSRPILFGFVLGAALSPLAFVGYAAAFLQLKAVPQVRQRLSSRKVKLRGSLFMGVFTALLYLGSWVALVGTPGVQIQVRDSAIGALIVFGVGSPGIFSGLTLASQILG